MIAVYGMIELMYDNHDVYKALKYIESDDDQKLQDISFGLQDSASQEWAVSNDGSSKKQ